MTARALIAEAAAVGVTLYRIGERVRWRATAPPSPDLLDRLRQHREELLRLVPDRDPTAAPPTAPETVDHAAIFITMTATFGTAADLDAFTWADQHGHPDVIRTLGALEHRCEQLARDGADAATYRAAVARLVGYVQAIRAAYHATEEQDATPAEAIPGAPAGATWRLVVEQTEPRPGPIQFGRCLTIADPAKCIAADLADLAIAVAARSAGRSGSVLVARIDEIVARLRACGCAARVEPVQ